MWIQIPPGVIHCVISLSNSAIGGYMYTDGQHFDMIGDLIKWSLTKSQKLEQNIDWLLSEIEVQLHTWRNSMDGYDSVTKEEMESNLDILDQIIDTIRKE